MYELEYVRRRKRRKLVAIFGFVSASVVTSLAIISFLGRYVGTFTVKLETRNVELALSEKKASEKHSSFLRVSAEAPFQEFTYGDFDRRFGDAVIDSDESSVDLGANFSKNDPETIESFNFFKYTFFVNNSGTLPAKYDFQVNITEDVLGDDGRSLLDTVRVMLYEDGEKTVYGKADTKPHYDENGDPDYRAPISVSEHDATEYNPFLGYAEEFSSSEVVTTLSGRYINVGDAKRYTIVTWLEGFRSDSNQNAPKGATIKLGVEINAYENE